MHGRVRWVVEKFWTSAGECQSNVCAERDNTRARARQAFTTGLHLHPNLASLLQPSRTINIFYLHAFGSVEVCTLLENAVTTCSKHRRSLHLQNTNDRPQEPNYRLGDMQPCLPASCDDVFQFLLSMPLYSGRSLWHDARQQVDRSLTLKARIRIIAWKLYRLSRISHSLHTAKPGSGNTATPGKSHETKVHKLCNGFHATHKKRTS